MQNHQIKNALLTSALLASALGLTACGGGGGGGDTSMSRMPQAAIYDQFGINDHVLFAVADDGSLQQQIISNGSFQFISDYVLSPGGDRVAMIADDQLYVSSLDRMNFIRVSTMSNSAGGVRAYEWSPNGEQLIYLADGNTIDKVELYQVNRDGSNHFRISGTIDSSPGLDIASAHWSPDGQYVAYLVENNGVAIGLNTHRFSEPPDRNSLRVSQQSRSDTDISGLGSEAYKWSPDGSLLAWRQDSHSNNVYTLHTARPDGSSLNQASAPYVASYPLGNFSWSADSRYLAYNYAHTQNSLNQVFCHDLQNPQHPGQLVTSSNTEIDYQWAHTAPLLAYSSDGRVGNVREMFVYDASNDSSGKITHGNSNMEDILSLHWSAADHYIGYGTASGLYVAAPQSMTAARQVANFDTSSQLLSGWSWSPDERRLAYVTRDGNRRPASSLFYASVENTGPATTLAGPETGITGFQPGWSKDASRLLYISAGQLHSVSLADSSDRVISGSSSVLKFAY